MRRPDLGALWHALAGAGLMLAALLLPVLLVPALAAFGIYRERWQHPSSPLREWMAHRWLEALAWPAGGAVVLAAVAIVRRVLSS
jgi:Cu/Ag efflux pump CusA